MPREQLSTFVVTDVLGQVVTWAREPTSPDPGRDDHTEAGNRTSYCRNSKISTSKSGYSEIRRRKFAISSKTLASRVIHRE